MASEKNICSKMIFIQKTRLISVDTQSYQCYESILIKEPVSVLVDSIAMRCLQIDTRRVASFLSKLYRPLHFTN